MFRLQSSSNVMGISRLLAAVMEAMCHPAVKLTAIMPINCEPETEAVLRRHSMSIDDNTNAMARVGEVHRYPLLATHMTCRMEVRNESHAVCVVKYIESRGAKPHTSGLMR